MLRHTLQAQLYATQARLNQLETDAKSAVATVSLVGTATIQQQTVRGELHLLVECTFVARQDGETIVQAIVDRAIQRQAIEPSYVWLKTVDDVAGTISERTASSPSWIIAERTYAY